MTPTSYLIVENAGHPCLHHACPRISSDDSSQKTLDSERSFLEPFWCTGGGVEPAYGSVVHITVESWGSSGPLVVRYHYLQCGMHSNVQSWGKSGTTPTGFLSSRFFLCDQNSCSTNTKGLLDSQTCSCRRA